MTKFTKTKAQMKSSSYYLFWGIATLAVVAGQVYVGTGYRAMSNSLDAWFDKTISIMIQNVLCERCHLQEKNIIRMIWL